MEMFDIIVNRYEIFILWEKKRKVKVEVFLYKWWNEFVVFIYLFIDLLD